MFCSGAFEQKQSGRLKCPGFVQPPRSPHPCGLTLIVACDYCPKDEFVGDAEFPTKLRYTRAQKRMGGETRAQVLGDV